MKITWNILNNIIKPNSQHIKLPEYFVYNETVMNNSIDVANEFNSFFINIGENIAKSIDISNQSQNVTCRMESRIMQSMFLGEVQENEILSIVTKCENKTSTDSYGLDMAIVKRTIDCIINPLTFIFNLSIHSGVFPEKMKVAKVVPLFKNGDVHHFNNYRPVSLLSQFSKILEKWFAQKLNIFFRKT